MGKQIHEAVVRWGLLEKDIVLGTSLVDMYAKCGMLEKAEQVLEGLSVRNVVSWSAIIAGYSQQGHGRRALRCFERMQGEGHSPNEVTFLSVLTACSHSGLMEEARKLFEDMDVRYGITTRSEHHACMVAAFGCAGFFNEALSTIEAMPSLDSPIPWLALLGSCRKWGNVRLAISTFDRVVQLDNTCAAAYILMADIFGASGMRDDADKVEAMWLKYAAASERVGSSLWVDTSGKFQFFLDPT
jgi:pentatricopeptide repeat protein